MLVVMAETTHRQLPCLSVHDSVVCRVEDESVVIGLMQAVSCFYLGAVLPADGKTTAATVTLTSELYSHEMTEASRHSVPLGIHRLQREASTVAETSKQRSAAKRRAIRAAALQEEYDNIDLL
ncbi:hypothetical protein N9872_02895 [Paraglaciecola sp.]|nr:hypothetical protein [Paraglaciecola sp.]MDB4281902.1 hypothetical protein [Paraglaciecola sp.]